MQVDELEQQLQKRNLLKDEVDMSEEEQVQNVGLKPVLETHEEEDEDQGNGEIDEHVQEDFLGTLLQPDLEVLELLLDVREVGLGEEPVHDVHQGKPQVVAAKDELDSSALLQHSLGLLLELLHRLVKGNEVHLVSLEKGLEMTIVQEALVDVVVLLQVDLVDVVEGLFLCK